MQPTGTVWTNLVEEHLTIIPVKFGKSNERFQRRRWLSKQEAQKALAHSPEEKVKGHSGAI